MVTPGDPSYCLASDPASHRSGFCYRLVCLAPMPSGHSAEIPLQTEPATVMLPGARILLVEDEALTAIAMAQAVEAAGYQVLGPVGRVQDAIDMAQTTRPDAAVLDVNLLG